MDINLYINIALIFFMDAHVELWCTIYIGLFIYILVYLLFMQDRVSEPWLSWTHFFRLGLP